MRKFETLTPGRRKEHLRSLVTAKRPETRAKRIALIVRTVA
ncbi:MAG: YdeI/OmpD-associated family protein [Chloroflexota bacterium]